MSRAFVIGVVLSPRPWSVRLHAFVADHVPDAELVVVRDRRAALSSGAQVLVLDSTTPWLTPTFVTESEDAGVRLVGVYDRADGGTSRDRLAGLGLTHLLEEAMPPEDVVFLVDRLRPAVALGERRGRRAAADPVATDGAVIAVGGPSGSGAREVAVGLATHWAESGWVTLLVDANETTPGVARRLGFGLYPHVLTAVERSASDGVDGVRSALADRVGPVPFDTIAGLATPRDWDRLVAGDLAELLSVCRRGWDRVVVTTSPLIEDLARWGNRFGISRHVLANADAVVGVAEPTPRGVLRFLDWVVDAGRLRADVVTVLNKVPRARRVAFEARQQLVDAGGALVGDVCELPLDRSVAAAEWDGIVVSRGRFRKALAAVADEVEQRLIVDDEVVTA
jgi:CO dehydrogenase nickel-insertion accessory protein CooC1